MRGDHIQVIVFLFYVIRPSLQLRQLTQDTDQYSDRNPQKYQNCEGQIDQFLNKCKYNDINNLRRTQDDSLSPCCWSDECCNEFQQLSQSSCLTCNEFSNLSSQMLETFTIYRSMCNVNQTSNLDFECIDQNSNIASTDNCVNIGQRLIQNCGYQQSQQIQQLLVKEGRFASCCWPQNCCELSIEYLQNNCLGECYDQEKLQNYQYGYWFGNSLAKLWHDACNFPEEWKQCGYDQVMKSSFPFSEGINITMTIDFSTKYIYSESDTSYSYQSSGNNSFTSYSITQPYNTISLDYQYYPTESSPDYDTYDDDQDYDVNQGYVLDQGSEYEVGVGVGSPLGVNQPYAQINRYVPLPQQPGTSVDLLSRVSGDCSGNELFSVYGPEQPLRSTIHTFCTIPSLYYLASLNREQVQLCCDISTNIVEQVCEHFKYCPSESLDLLNSTVLSTLQVWEKICAISVQNCPKQQALSLVTSVSQIVQSQENPLVAAVGNLDQLIAEDLSQLESIFDAIKSTPMLSIFSFILDYWSIQDQLTSQGPVTIFAPTNSAFTEMAQLMGMTTTELTSNVSSPEVIRIVLGHIAQGYLSKELLQQNLQVQINTVDTGLVTLNLDVPSSVQIIGCCSQRNRANVISLASFPNGVLWVTDRTLLPESLANSIYNS